jgi:acetoacetate decarboxylase
MPRDHTLDSQATRALRRIESEQLLFAYESDPTAIRALLPEPLQAQGNVVVCAFAATPLPARGAEVEMRVLLPARLHERDVLYRVQTFLDEDDALTAAARIGLATRHAQPRLVQVHDTVCGVLAVGGNALAVGGLQASSAERECTPPAMQQALLQSLEVPQAQLRVILDGSGVPALAQLIATSATEVRVRHAWSGAAQLQFLPYPPAPLADLPVQRMLGGVHVFAELTLGATRVLHDYCTGKRHGGDPAARRDGEHAVAELVADEVLQ